MCLLVFNFFQNGLFTEIIFVPLVPEHIVDFCIVCFEDLACNSSFWKKMEPFFASVSLEDTSYLKQEVATRIHDYD